jgi:hypothetical protein
VRSLHPGIRSTQLRWEYVADLYSTAETALAGIAARVQIGLAPELSRCLETFANQCGDRLGNRAFDSRLVEIRNNRFGQFPIGLLKCGWCARQVILISSLVRTDLGSSGATTDSRLAGRRSCKVHAATEKTGRYWRLFLLPPPTPGSDSRQPSI